MIFYVCELCGNMRLGVRGFVFPCHGPMVELVDFERLMTAPPRVLRLRSLLREESERDSQGGSGARRSVIPYPVSRPRFTPDPAFIWTDIGQRAITGVSFILNLERGRRSFSDRELALPFYRTHPGAVELYRALNQGAITLNIPTDGEVMYVVTTDYELIIASREGHEHHVPHPTLIGGEEPAVLSAGIIEFFQGQISRVCINHSGHFKPNALSSVEVSLALFGRLPLRIFHQQFQGFVIFGFSHVVTGTSGVSGSPFTITHNAPPLAPTERTIAMDINSARLSIVALTNSDAKTPLLVRQRQAKTSITASLAAGAPPPFPYSLLCSRYMHKLYAAISRDIALSGGNKFKAASQHGSYGLLLWLFAEAFQRLWGTNSDVANT